MKRISKDLIQKIKESSNIALALFALLGLLLNEGLDMGLDTTALQSIADFLINLL